MIIIAANQQFEQGLEKCIRMAAEMIFEYVSKCEDSIPQNGNSKASSPTETPSKNVGKRVSEKELRQCILILALTLRKDIHKAKLERTIHEARDRYSLKQVEDSK